MTEPKTTRITIDLMPAAVEECDRLMEQTGIQTKAEFFRHALSLMRVVCDEIEKGNTIESGGVRIRFPLLEKK